MQSLKLHRLIPGGTLVGKAKPGANSDVQGVFGPNGERWFPAGRTFDRRCAAAPQAKVPVDPGENHIHWCWNKDIKGEAWRQMRVVIFHKP